MKSMVRKGGFEPPRLSAPPPQDGVSASSTTSALCRINNLQPKLQTSVGDFNLKVPLLCSLSQTCGNGRKASVRIDFYLITHELFAPTPARGNQTDPAPCNCSFTCDRNNGLPANPAGLQRQLPVLYPSAAFPAARTLPRISVSSPTSKAGDSNVRGSAIPHAGVDRLAAGENPWSTGRESQTGCHIE